MKFDEVNPFVWFLICQHIQNNYSLNKSSATARILSCGLSTTNILKTTTASINPF
ncbi:hypothetical protein [Flavobacterium sp.]|uniref:hypothetical protein n=1 Tax=Flavobacterium sp. TaxID=239 RepID=UPI003919B971